MMSSVVGFLTSKTGVFAAILAAVGLAVLIHNSVRPYFTEGAARRRERARIEITDVTVGEIVSWGNVRELRFMVTNSGGRQAVVRSLRARVDRCEPSPHVRKTETAAPVTVYEHRIELAPDQQVVDIRKRAFGKQLPPLTFDKGETAAFVVKLVSRTSHRYQLRVEAEWFDSGKVEDEQLTHTEYVEVDFPRTSLTG